MRQLLVHAAGALLGLVSLSAAGAPTTFGPVIGSALLCRSHLDNAYFYSYLTAAFGPAYKHEGGAYWFKADGTLWGAAVTEVMVSDDTSETIFIGAVTETTPEQLDESIRAALGLRHVAIGAAPFPVREAGPGSRIVYFKDKSKIFCAKFKPLYPGR